MYRRFRTERDPYWLKARFTSKCCKCGQEVQKGADIFYFPKDRSVFCESESCGQAEYRSFRDSVEIENDSRFRMG